MKFRHPNTYALTLRQRGSALIVSLAVLTAVTVAATIAVEQSTLQVRMVTNMKAERETFTSAVNLLETAFANQVAAGTATVSQLISDEMQALATQRSNGVDEDDLVYRQATMNPFDVNNWDKPSIDKLATQTEGSVSMVYASDMASKSPYDLKNGEGCSAKACQKYPFIMTSTATTNNGNISSSVQLGLQIIGAAQN